MNARLLREYEGWEVVERGRDEVLQARLVGEGKGSWARDEALADSRRPIDGDLAVAQGVGA
jgi:hypothetical protein